MISSSTMINRAQKGIWALIQCSGSFHGLKDERFVITNVFGTAHAQWGNSLVLGGRVQTSNPDQVYPRGRPAGSLCEDDQAAACDMLMRP